MAVTISGTTGIAGVDGSAGTPAVQGADTNTGIFFPAADTIAFAEGGAEVMRIDSSGNVGIGTAGTIPKTLTINGGNAGGFTDVLQLSAGSTANNSGPGITFNDNYGNYASYSNWQLGAIRAGAPSASANFAGYLAFFTNNATSASDLVERARIDSSGRLLVNTTSGTANALFQVSSNGTKQSFQVFNNDNVQLYSLGTGTVYSNGGVFTNTNPSDERLKENISELPFGLSQILALRPVSYTWKNDKINQGTQYGFIAQEVQPIIPDLVREFESQEGEETVIRFGLEKEGIYAAMVKAIQEQQALINDLTARIAALEGAK